MQVINGPVLAAMLAIDEILDHARLQRTRPIQRKDGDEIIEMIRLQPLDQIAHASRFELKDCHRLAIAQQLVGPLIVDR